MDIGYLLRDIESNLYPLIYPKPNTLCNPKFDIN